MKLWNFKGEQNSITDALRVDLPAHAVISLTGSGGKTSLMLAWARELAASGKRVAITTSTHMLDPAVTRAEELDIYKGIPVIYADSLSVTSLSSSPAPEGSAPEKTADEDPAPERTAAAAPSAEEPADKSAFTQDEIDRALFGQGIVMVASHDPDNPAKVISPPASVLDYICKTADAVLIEADGSRRMPLKWPAPWEPAVPDNTDITICVAGLSGLGRKLSEAMYRSEYLPEAMRKDQADEYFLSAVLSSLDGGQKGAQGEFRIFMNQADTEDLQKSAALMQMLFAVRGIQSAWGTML